MDRALALATQGGRAVMPNPLVGAVLVRDGEVIGEGYHESFGSPHAEVNAIQRCTDRAKLCGATLYVTLEPCSHFGKTPPCADLIIATQIARVVIGCRDPFPEVAGKGIARLQAAGIEVIEGIRHRESVLLNKRFILAHRLKRPYIILKWAQTSDGFIARSDGSSKWISSEASRILSHQWRAQEMSILVGATTARIDDPRLTVRHVQGPHPLRLVLDAALSLPAHRAIFTKEADTIVFNAEKSERRGHVTLERIDFQKPIAAQIVRALFQRSIISLIIEGGTRTLQTFIDADLWDEARVFISPHSFGSGITAPTLQIPSESVTPSGEDRLYIF